MVLAWPDSFNFRKKLEASTLNQINYPTKIGVLEGMHSRFICS